MQASDFRTLWSLVAHPIRGGTHQERLDSFYRKQAEHYDRFRERLLRGRAELYKMIDAPTGGVWVDLGGGTGANLSHLAPRLPGLAKVYLVDLCEPLVEVARRRVAENNWANVEVVQADATRFVPPEQEADVVTFAYSLTMIPDWFAAIEHALSLLRPGGLLGVVDFYVSRKHPHQGWARHGWATRTFWPIWFATDNVHLNPDHVPFLHSRLEPLTVSEHRAPVPYLPLARVPYYRFIGRKRG